MTKYMEYDTENIENLSTLLKPERLGPGGGLGKIE